MNKAELIAKVAEKTGLSLNASSKTLDGVLDSIIEAVNGRDNVILVGFGTFTVKERAARNGHNPSTGQKMVIPAKQIVKFTSGSRMHPEKKK